MSASKSWHSRPTGGMGASERRRAALGPPWSFAGLHEAARDLSQLDVALLGGPGEDVECLVSGELEAFHEDALRLLNDSARLHGLTQVSGFVTARA